MMNTLLRIGALSGMTAALLVAPLNAGAAATDTVSAFLSAYNEHDSAKMLQHVASNVRWMSVSDNKINVEADGKSALAAYMDGYFESMPSTRSEPREIQSIGNFVSVIEEAQWQRDGKHEAQCAAAMYELRDGLIQNVWYFKVQPCKNSSLSPPTLIEPGAPG